MASLSTIRTPEPAAPLSAPPEISSDSPAAADGLAARNRSTNLAALASTQPRLARAAPAVPGGVRFVFGRDGYLTAFDAAGRWWSGCSLPHRAATAMLRNLQMTGIVACLLPPPHAAAVRVALDTAEPRQAVVVLAPDPCELSLVLACDDFSAEIRGHRLWFAWGPAWEQELSRLLDQQPGLPMPAQFIRVPVGDPDATEPAIAAAQAVFAAAGANRAEATRRARDGWKPPARGAAEPPRLCVVGGRDFRLWDDAAFTLAAALSGPGGAAGEAGAPSASAPCASNGGAAECVTLFPDDPASAGPLALVSAAAGCDAVVTADTGRGDLPGLLPTGQPWLTWVTKPRLPAFAAAGPSDVLLLADPAWERMAIESGWPAERVGIARWPDLAALWAADAGRAREEESAVAPFSPTLGLIADCGDLEPPAKLDEFSSHRLLWNAIRSELESDPLLLAAPGSDPAAYLEARRGACDVAGENFDRQLFLQRLIFPCYARCVARLLLKAGLPLRLFGRGWETGEEFAPHAGGAIASRAALARAVSNCTALVHAWPTAQAHPIEAAGKPVVRPAGRGAEAFVRAAKRALASRDESSRHSPPGPPLSLAAVLRQLRICRAAPAAA